MQESVGGLTDASLQKQAKSLGLHQGHDLLEKNWSAKKKMFLHGKLRA
jgi:hypothetical protein